jgi:hypothetical protein
MNLLVHLADLLMHLPRLPDQGKKRGPRKRRDEIATLVFNQSNQRADTGNALPRYDAELREVAAQAFTSIVRCRIKRSRTLCSINTLCCSSLPYWNEPHRRPRHRLADRAGIHRVFLLPHMA